MLSSVSFDILPDQLVLLLGSFKAEPTDLSYARDTILKGLSSPDLLDFEQLERLQEVNLTQNKYHRIFVGLPPYDSDLPSSVLKLLLSALKPNGKIVYCCAPNKISSKEMEARFKLSGFVSISRDSNISEENSIVK
ncbi:electron carrier, partial [Massospora cicadina]